MNDSWGYVHMSFANILFRFSLRRCLYTKISSWRWRKDHFSFRKCRNALLTLTILQKLINPYNRLYKMHAREVVESKVNNEHPNSRQLMRKRFTRIDLRQLLNARNVTRDHQKCRLKTFVLTDPTRNFCPENGCKDIQHFGNAVLSSTQNNVTN